MARSRAKQGARSLRVKLKDPVTGKNLKDQYGRVRTRPVTQIASAATRARWEAEAEMWAEIKAAREAEARLEAEAEALQAGILST